MERHMEEEEEQEKKKKKKKRREAAEEEDEEGEEEDGAPTAIGDDGTRVVGDPQVNHPRGTFRLFASDGPTFAPPPPSLESVEEEDDPHPMTPRERRRGPPRRRGPHANAEVAQDRDTDTDELRGLRAEYRRMCEEREFRRRTGQWTQDEDSSEEKVVKDEDTSEFSDAEELSEAPEVTVER